MQTNTSNTHAYTDIISEFYLELPTPQTLCSVVVLGEAIIYVWVW